VTVGAPLLHWRGSYALACRAHNIFPTQSSISTIPLLPLLSPQISDPNKLKKMNKKQLRLVKRTRINKDGVMELVPAYAK
jgi:hypothetical protein